MQVGLLTCLQSLVLDLNQPSLSSRTLNQRQTAYAMVSYRKRIDNTNQASEREDRRLLCVFYRY
jgi:hypothetical protein